MESESPTETKKGKSKTPKKAKESILKQSMYYVCMVGMFGYMYVWVMLRLFCFFVWVYAESPAEFFAENKNIAGFDNVCYVFPLFISVLHETAIRGKSASRF